MAGCRRVGHAAAGPHGGVLRGTAVAARIVLRNADPLFWLVGTSRPQRSEERRKGFQLITLGLNHSNQHDSSAAIVKDGVPLFAIAEERLSKIKHDGGFPRHAMKACLDHVGISIADIDSLVIGWQ